MEKNTVILDRQTYDNLVNMAGRREMKIEIILSNLQENRLITIWNPEVKLPEYEDFSKKISEDINDHLANELEKQIRDNTALEIINKGYENKFNSLKKKLVFKLFGGKLK